MRDAGDMLGLNAAQLEAVNHDAGPVLVLAGPGTGKTRVIIARLLRLLREGKDPGSLLAVTFSVKAAQEMRERLEAWARDHLPEGIARGAARVQVTTFHGLGRRLTRRFGDVLGVAPDAALLDHAVAMRMLRRLARQMELFPWLAVKGYRGVLEDHLRFESSCKHNAKDPAEAVAFAARWRERLEGDAGSLDEPARAAALLAQKEFEHHARLYEAFDRECLDRGLFTFDDDIAYPLRVFRKRPELAAFLRAEHRHVVVDELQDVNPAQLELLEWIAPPRPDGHGPDLCAVGDDDQAIYAFRGSDPAAVEAFRAIWPTHHTVKLEENHRSADKIVRVANEIIAHAHQRALGGKSIRAAGSEHGHGIVEAFTVPTDNDHGHLIATVILSDRAGPTPRRWSDYAVLCRSATQLERVSAALALRGIPIDFRRSSSPRDEPAVQDLFAWLRLLSDAHDDASTQRLLVRPNFGVSLERVSGWRRAHAAERRAAGADAFPGLADWLARDRADVPEVARFAGLLAELRRGAASMPADQAVEHVVRAAHLMGDDTPELLDPLQRARRARALVDVIRYVRSRQPFLEHPGDIAAYLAYERDLDDEGRRFRAPSLDTEQEEDQLPDAVSVVTAHRAKGLEWDTVFVVKVGLTQGSFGAGKREERGELSLPAQFTGRPEPDENDEEVRLLYVACTRARRRLVLTAKKKAPPRPRETQSRDLFITLTHFRTDLGVTVTEMEDVLRAAGAETPSPLEEALASRSEWAPNEEQIRREAVHARRWAFAALHDAHAPGAADTGLQGAESRLVDAARALASLARLREGDHRAAAGLLESLSENSPLRARVEGLMDRLARRQALEPWPAPNPPLTLSYTQINAFEDCPRCWYLRFVLGLLERTGPAASLGQIAHDALRHFYARHRDSDDPARTPTPRDLHTLADAAFDRGCHALDPDADELRRTLHAQLDVMLERLHPTTHQVLELEFEVRMPVVDARGRTHTLTAKIDRLDLGADGSYRLIDYKTGEATADLVHPKPADLQLNIYAMALAYRIGAPEGGEVPLSGRAEYWLLSRGELGAIDLAELDLHGTRARILKAVEGMLTPPYERGKQCRGHCELMD